MYLRITSEDENVGRQYMHLLSALLKVCACMVGLHPCPQMCSMGTSRSSVETKARYLTLLTVSPSQYDIKKHSLLERDKVSVQRRCIPFSTIQPNSSRRARLKSSPGARSTWRRGLSVCEQFPSPMGYNTPRITTMVAARMRQATSSLVLVAMILVCTFASNGVCTHTQQEIYVPSYVYPCSGTTGCAWDVFKANATLVIINPNSGPGTASNPDYVNLVNTVKTGATSKVKIVLGYVSTSYGARASSLVLSDIDKYYSFYNVDGIFLDEGNTSCASSALLLYNSYDARVKAKAGLGYTVLNWGVYGNQCYLTNTHIDNYVTFEDAFANYNSVGAPPAWVNSYDSSRFWNILHTAPNNAASVTAAVATAKSRNVGQVYITNDVLPNPYDTAPSSTVWTAEVSKAISCT